VTLDLNGYTVAGPGLAGVSVNNQNVTVRNGRVAGWSGNGVEVNLSSPGPRQSQFDSVVASDNGGSGFFIFGPARFQSCQAVRNGTGFFGDPGSNLSPAWRPETVAAALSFMMGARPTAASRRMTITATI